ncbi:hypothetical protein [Sorangium sp. So ce1078]|uniref:hypothetical protein n=1 Tax=Sorangium sp. So ce1078 TaxID=3133329 RepID=UPI003F5FCA29
MAAPYSEAERLADNLLDGPQVRVAYLEGPQVGVAYSASRRRFAFRHVQDHSQGGYREEILFTDEDGKKRDTMVIVDTQWCQTANFDGCDERIYTSRRRLSTRLQADGYVSLRRCDTWQPYSSEGPVPGLGMGLRYEKDRLLWMREGKPPLQLGYVGRGVPDVPAGVCLVPEARRIVAVGQRGKEGVARGPYFFKLPSGTRALPPGDDGSPRLDGRQALGARLPQEAPPLLLER